MGNPFLTLYRNRKTGDCLIERYVGIYAVGKFVNVSSLEMKKGGLEIVLRCLNGELQPKTGEKSERSEFSREEEKAFHRLYRGVAIFEEDGGSMKIGILRRQGSGYVVRKEDIVKLSLPYTNEAFLEALAQAFE